MFSGMFKSDNNNSNKAIVPYTGTSATKNNNRRAPNNSSNKAIVPYTGTTATKNNSNNKAIVPYTGTTATKNNSNNKAIVPYTGTTKNNNNRRANKNNKPNNSSSTTSNSNNNNRVKNNSNSNNSDNNNDAKVFPLPFEQPVAAQTFKNMLKRDNGAMKATNMLVGMDDQNVTNMRNIKTLDGNKVYYKRDAEGMMRPIIIFIKSTSDSLNKSNLNMLANVLSDKMPMRNRLRNSNKYVFSESGPFGSGYYHDAYFTTSRNNIQWINNPMFDNKSPMVDMKYGNLLRKMNNLRNMDNQMRSDMPNNMFEDFTPNSKAQRAQNLNRVANALRKKNKMN